MSAVATAIVGSAIIGGIASNSAADTQASAANNASAINQAQYQQTRADQAPWRQAGANSLATIAELQPQFQHQFNANDLKTNLAPNYQFQLDQGLGATKNFANSTGGLVGGNTLKAINDYAQNYAGNAYQQAFNNYNAQQTNIFNRLSQIAGLGSTANQTTAQAGTAAANASGNFLTSGAAAQAAGTVGSANAISNGLSNFAGWNYLKGGGSGASYTPGADAPMYVTDPYYTSDRRRKSNIHRIGTHRLGIGVYSYVIDGEPDIGVMADEVEHVMPEAVVTGSDGYKRVNYALIGGL